MQLNKEILNNCPIYKHECCVVLQMNICQTEVTLL